MIHTRPSDGNLLGMKKQVLLGGKSKAGYTGVEANQSIKSEGSRRDVESAGNRSALRRLSSAICWN